MNTDLLARVPGTREWLRATFTPKVELKLRQQLRKLERDADARAAVLWLGHGDRDDVIAFSGDTEAIPKRFAISRSTVPSYEELVLDGGERVSAVVHVVQLGRGLPMLRVAAIAPGPAESAQHFDSIERCAERLEEIAVASL